MIPLLLVLQLAAAQPSFSTHCWLAEDVLACDNGYISEVRPAQPEQPIPARLVLPSVDHPIWAHLAIGGVMVLHGADIATTMYCRGARTCYEANWLLRPFQDDPVVFAAVKMGVAVGITYALLRLHEQHPRAVLVASVLIGAGIGYVTWQNGRGVDLARGR